MVTAIARDLVGFIWAIARVIEPVRQHLQRHQPARKDTGYPARMTGGGLAAGWRGREDPVSQALARVWTGAPTDARAPGRGRSSTNLGHAARPVAQSLSEKFCKYPPAKPGALITSRSKRRSGSLRGSG